MSAPSLTTRLAKRTAHGTARTGWRAAIRLVLWGCRLAITLAVGAVFGWVRDLPRSVDGDEREWARWAPAASAIFWPAGAIWLAAGAPRTPALLIGLADATRARVLPVGVWAVIVTAFACTIVMRRVLAAGGHSWRIGSLITGTARWVDGHRWLGLTLVLGCVALPLWWATGDQSETGRVIGVLTVLGVAVAVATHERRWRRRVAMMVPALSAACDVLPSVISDEAVLVPIKGSCGFRMVRVPPRVVDQISGIEDRVAAHLSDLEPVVHRHDHLGHITSLTFQEVGRDELERRAVVAATGGLVSRLVPVDQPDPSRPDEHIAHLTDIVTPTRGGKVDVAMGDRGFSIVDWAPDAQVAHVARLSPQTQALRARLCTELGLRDPWDLELRVEPDLVEVVRGPALGGPEKRTARWREMSASIFRADDGERWLVADDAQTGTVMMRRVPDVLRNVQTYPWDAPVSLNALPFGVSEDGSPLTLGLLEMNQLIGGTPGGGKSGGLTALLCGIARLENVALIGLDPKRVEQRPWSSRFSRIATNEDDATDVLERIRDEMERRYEWLEHSGLKKFGPEQFSPERPLLVLVVDELADLVAVAVDKEEKAAEVQRSTLIRRLIAKGRAAGISTIQATQKPSSDVVPTSLRDLTQLRVAYATTNSDMTDTILGKGMTQNGGEAHTISASERGVCYVVNESSRLPQRARTYWVPDEDVEDIAEQHAHLRIDLPWLTDDSKAASTTVHTPTVIEVIDELSVSLDELDAAFE